MGRYLARRLLWALIMMWLVASMALLLGRLAGSDIIAQRLGIGAKIELVEAERHSRGLDRPLPVQYLSWLAGLARLDFGTSAIYGRPVGELVATATRNTALIATLAFLLAVRARAAFGSDDRQPRRHPERGRSYPFGTSDIRATTAHVAPARLACGVVQTRSNWRDDVEHCGHDRRGFRARSARTPSTPGARTRAALCGNARARSIGGAGAGAERPSGLRSAGAWGVPEGARLASRLAAWRRSRRGGVRPDGGHTPQRIVCRGARHKLAGTRTADGRGDVRPRHLPFRGMCDGRDTPVVARSRHRRSRLRTHRSARPAVRSSVVRGWPHEAPGTSHRRGMAARRRVRPVAGAVYTVAPVSRRRVRAANAHSCVARWRPGDALHSSLHAGRSVDAHVLDRRVERRAARRLQWRTRAHDR